MSGPLVFLNVSLCCAATVALLPPARKPPDVRSFFIYAGTHRLGGRSRGIFAWRFNPETGTAHPIGLVGHIRNPFVIVPAPDGSHLFAGTNRDAKTEDAVASFAVDQTTGHLRLLNSAPSRGVSTCHLAVDSSAKMLVAANYRSGNVAAFSLKSDGTIGELTALVRHEGSSVNRERQEGPHPHAIVFSPDNRFALVPDLGIDRIMVYRVDPANAQLRANDEPSANVAAGAGPRHLAFSRDGTHVWVLNELQSSITTFAWDARDGSLFQRDTVSTLPPGYSAANTAAEIELGPSGRFLYASNRGRDSIAAFSIDPSGGLTPLGHVPSGGREPWSFKIAPDGRHLFVANKLSDKIAVFQLDMKTGLPVSTGIFLDVPSPICVAVIDAR
jgi:6-phosphogluconolactonase